MRFILVLILGSILKACPRACLVKPFPAMCFDLPVI